MYNCIKIVLLECIYEWHKTLHVHALDLLGNYYSLEYNKTYYQDQAGLFLQWS